MIYDCFTFFNELDLLEIRLNTLNHVVDKFVLVEATRTFQGKEKPLFFELHKNRYKDFEHKIIHVIVDDFPIQDRWYRKVSAWDFERYQRNMIKKGLAACKQDDIILVSDIDEIVKPDLLVNSPDSNEMILYELRNFSYYLNCAAVDIEKWWFGPICLRYRNFTSPQQLRTLAVKVNKRPHLVQKGIRQKLKSLLKPLYRKKISIHHEGGWHFSYLGGTKKIIEKLEAYSHTEYNDDLYKNEEVISKKIRSGEDIFGRPMKYEFLQIDEKFPSFIQANLAKYKHLIFLNF